LRLHDEMTERQTAGALGLSPAPTHRRCRRLHKRLMYALDAVVLSC